MGIKEGGLNADDVKDRGLWGNEFTVFRQRDSLKKEQEQTFRLTECLSFEDCSTTRIQQFLVCLDEGFI